MNIRIRNIVGVMGMMIATAALACDEPEAADAGAASEPFQVVSSAASETRSNSDLTD